MSGILPTVRGTAAAIYPVARGNNAPTVVCKFLNASEQRFQRNAQLADFELRYLEISAGDRDALKAFYAQQKGQFDSTWSFTFNTVPYTNLTFLDDSFVSVEGPLPNRYDVGFKFRQTITQSTPAAGALFFPTLSTGATSQRPYAQIQRYRTSLNDNPNGKRYSYAWYEAGLTGFPTRGLFSWKLEFPSISDADMATLEQFFVGVGGRYRTFSFTDPDSAVTYPNVRFDQETFAYRYLALNQASTTILLAEPGYPGNSL